MHSPRTDTPWMLGGRYRVIKRLGSGGMASVLLAEDERLGRLVALKRLSTSSMDEALARFRREAQLGASLNHPNVVSIYDSAIDADGLLIIMEYVDGESLKDRLRRGPLDPGQAITVLSGVAAALDHAHSAGVIHRDVKPSNVLIAIDGTAKLADLGIATAVDATSITTTNAVIGTLTYLAPERLEGAENHPSADVFSLAAVAFEALSGQRAQRGTTPAEVVGSVDPPDLRNAWPNAPPAAAEVLREGLARDPERRPRSAGELVDHLSAALTAEETQPLATEGTVPTVLDREPSIARAVGRWSRRRAALAAVAATLAGAVIAIAALGGDSGGRGKGRAADRVRTRTQAVTAPTTTADSGQVPQSGAGLGASLNDQGYSLIQQGRYEEAIPILQRAVDAFPDGSTDINYAYALFNLGHALRLAGRPQEAIPVLEQRLQIPDQTDAVAQELALARQQAGETPAPSGGTEPPEKDGPSGGVKPPKEPKPGKGPKGNGDD